MAVFFVFFTLAATGVPGLNNFVGEVLAISGMLSKSPLLAVLAATGIVLCWYALRLVQRLFFGKPNLGSLATYRGSDLGWTEFGSLLPLAALCLAIGVYPQWAMKLIEPDVKSLVAQFQKHWSGTRRPEKVTALAERSLSLEEQEWQCRN